MMRLLPAHAVLLGCLLLAHITGMLVAPQARALTPPQPSVTIFSDGLANPDGAIPKALAELTSLLRQENRIRLLSVMGHSGVANVQDLLNSLGVDFAVINNDVLAYLDQDKQLPAARAKIRYVSHLLSQRAYLVARKDITDLSGLSGKTLGLARAANGEGLTASIILQKSGLELGNSANQVNLVELPDDPPATLISSIDAIFVLENDLPALSAILSRSAEFHLVPIPLNEALSSIYRPARIAADEFASLGMEQDIETIAVDSLLATYDWNPRHGRYANVKTFIDALFTALPELRDRFPDSIWRSMDAHAEIPGWERFEYAEAAKAWVAKVEEQPAAKPLEAVEPAPQTDQNTADNSGKPQLIISAISAPPLTDKSDQSGGLIAELTMAVIKTLPSGNGGSAILKWEDDAQAQLKALAQENAAHLAIPWETPDCERPENLSAEQAMICDTALISAPIFQIPIVLFTKADSDFDFRTDESIDGRVLCIHSGRDASPITGAGSNWILDHKITLLRPATLIDCLNKVQNGEADALVGNEAESRFAINRLGLIDAFKIAERPIATKGIHIVIPKNQSGADAQLAELNQAIAEFKKNGDYMRIVGKYLPAFAPIRVSDR